MQRQEIRMQRKEFVSGVYHPADDARLELPRSIVQIFRDVSEFEEKRRRRKLRAQGRWQFTQQYDSSSDLNVARATYRMVGEKHPRDDSPMVSQTVVVKEKLVSQIMDACDKLRRSGISLESRMEYLISHVTPSLTPEEERAYKRRLGQRYAQRRAYRKQEDGAAWNAWLKVA